jgi:hypothetical protein
LADVCATSGIVSAWLRYAGVGVAAADPALELEDFGDGV